ncbi:hypothetical protein PXQ59_002150 [Vibrio parahaemolyticus]|nr:hypothetical protein [Vibrio parahaemolyticus]
MKLYFNESGDLTNEKQAKIDCLIYLDDQGICDDTVEEFQKDCGVCLSELTKEDLENDTVVYDSYAFYFDYYLTAMLVRNPKVIISDNLASDIKDMDIETIEKVFEYFDIEWSKSEKLDEDESLISYSVTFKNRNGEMENVVFD